MVSWSRVPRFYSIKMFRKNGQTAQKILVTLPEFWIWIRNNWIFFCLRGWFPSLLWYFLHYYTMILQRIRIITGDAGFKPGTSAPEVWFITNEPPYLLGAVHIQYLQTLNDRILSCSNAKLVKMLQRLAKISSVFWQLRYFSFLEGTKLQK